MVDSFIAHRLQQFTHAIRSAEKSYSREPHSVELLIASKAQSVENIQQAILSGGKHFGENYVQEALPKIAALHKEPITWHFTGRIQRNKTSKIAQHFDWVQTIDNIDVAERLNNARPDNYPLLNCCVQVNIDDDENKAGIHPMHLPELIQNILTLPKLRLQGLMLIPKKDNSNHAFKQIQSLKIDMENTFNMHFPVLSMGMTHDFERAIAHGSTMVRIGTGIFGERKPHE